MATLAGGLKKRCTNKHTALFIGILAPDGAKSLPRQRNAAHVSQTQPGFSYSEQLPVPPSLNAHKPTLPWCCSYYTIRTSPAQFPLRKKMSKFLLLCIRTRLYIHY